MRANVEERLGDVVAVRTESEFRYQGASAKADGGPVTGVGRNGVSGGGDEGKKGGVTGDRLGRKW